VREDVFFCAFKGFFELTNFKMANATVNRQRRFRALVLQNHPKSILKIIRFNNNKIWFTKRHFSNLDVENFERMKKNRY
jgi:hypothetical protein